jgi:20S proteasome alpha/beta subunit
MTIAINITVPEGLVFAADSRQTYTNARSDVRVSSDNAQKLFQLGARHAAVTYGWAFLCNRNIHSHVNDFKTTVAHNLTTQELANALGSYLTAQYHAHIEQKYDKAVDDKTYALALLVGGYDANSKVGEVYEVYVPGDKPILIHSTTERTGAAWRGHTLIIGRMLKGFDPRLRELEGYDEKLDKTLQDAPLDSLIDYWAMPLQDAVDLATFLVHTTIQLQRFSDGIRMAPGISANCGGPIEVAVVEPENGFQWLRHKTLHAHYDGNLVTNGET